MGSADPCWHHLSPGPHISAHRSPIGQPPAEGLHPAGSSGTTGATRLVESTPKHLGIRGSSDIKARRPELEGRAHIVNGAGCQQGDVHCRGPCRLLEYDVEKTIFGGRWSEGRGRWSMQGPFRVFPVPWLVRFALSQGEGSSDGSQSTWPLARVHPCW